MSKGKLYAHLIMLRYCEDRIFSQKWEGNVHYYSDCNEDGISNEGGFCMYNESLSHVIDKLKAYAEDMGIEFIPRKDYGTGPSLMYNGGNGNKYKELLNKEADRIGWTSLKSED